MAMLKLICIVLGIVKTVVLTDEFNFSDEDEINKFFTDQAVKQDVYVNVVQDQQCASGTCKKSPTYHDFSSEESSDESRTNERSDYRMHDDSDSSSSEGKSGRRRFYKGKNDRSSQDSRKSDSSSDSKSKSNSDSDSKSNSESNSDSKSNSKSNSDSNQSGENTDRSDDKEDGGASDYSGGRYINNANRRKNDLAIIQRLKQDIFLDADQEQACGKKKGGKCKKRQNRN